MHRESALDVDARPLAIDPSDREAVRLFYNRVYIQAPVSLGWTGNHATGDAGSVSLDYHASTVQRINWYRAMAGLPAATVFNAANSVGAQQAALMMSANGQLSHFPPATWKFYSAAGAQAAGQSNLALGFNGPDAIDAYIADFGDNNGPVGHRRWIFHPNSRSFGIGDVPRGKLGDQDLWGANALHVFDVDSSRVRSARDEFVAWPTRGYVPYKVVFGRWSLSHTNADFSKASVAVTRDGVPLAVKLEPVTNGYGENTIVWQIPAMPTQAYAMHHAAPSNDVRYHVTVSNVLVGGTTRSFDYDVTVFDPATPTAGAPAPQVSVPASLNKGSTYTAQVSPVAAATGYGLLAYRSKPVAQVPASEYTAGTWLAGSGISPDAVGQGELRLYHGESGAQAVQTLQLNRRLMASTEGASVSFIRSVGIATPSQSLKLQVSADDGANWIDVFSEPGAGTASIPASTVSASLARYAGREIRLRFTADPGQSYYPGVNSGWKVRDIRLQGISELVDGQDLRSSTGAFTLTAAQPGKFVFFPRVQYLGRYFSDAGPASFLEVQGAVLNGRLATYSLTRTNELVTITDLVGQDGTQTVRNPFRLDFTDLSLAFDVEGNAGKAYRLYRAAFDRTPEHGGLGFWIARLDEGVPIDVVAASFVGSAEFATLYGANPSNAQVLTALYRNVLHRAPDDGGFAFWMNQMDRGRTVQQLLVDFSESDENRKQVAPQFVLGIPYARWSP